IEGEVLTRDTADFERQPKPYNARFDHLLPQAAALCKTTEDVARTVAFIRRRGLESATRCGGHCFGGRSWAPGIVIDVSLMRFISGSDGIATIGAGARLGEVYGSLLVHGMTIPGGTCPSVGIAGLTLGGGFGMLGRKHALASDNLAGCRIVLADDQSLDCEEHHESDLSWALRGAGTGHFGVVTELRFRTVPVTSVVTTFNLFWPFSQAGRVVEAWLGWAGRAPDDLNDIDAKGIVSHPLRPT